MQMRASYTGYDPITGEDKMKVEAPLKPPRWDDVKEDYAEEQRRLAEEAERINRLIGDK